MSNEKKTVKANMEVPSHIGLSEYSRYSTPSPLMLGARSRAGIHKSRPNSMRKIWIDMLILIGCDLNQKKLKF